jgi:hypothetical protein
MGMEDPPGNDDDEGRGSWRAPTLAEVADGVKPALFKLIEPGLAIPSLSEAKELEECRFDPVLFPAFSGLSDCSARPAVL